MGKTTFKSEKKGSNILCRVSNPTPEMVCRYVQRLPKTIMSEEKFRTYMGAKWFQNEHQAPEQWGLYYIDGITYYPRFNRDITEKEAERYLFGWMKRLIVINPYTKFKISNDSNLVLSIVKELESNPDEHDLKTILKRIIGEGNEFIVNDILCNTLNSYSEVLKVDTVDKNYELFNVYLLPNYQEIINKKYMNKAQYFHSFDGISIDEPSKGHVQLICYGAPGTGKSRSIKESIAGKKHIRITFHPDSDYSSFVGCFKPVMEGEKIVYKYRPQAFINAYVQAWLTKDPFFLIIEEINRGNCAQIFGDMFQLLDRTDGESEYEVYPDVDLQNYLKEAFAAKDSIDAITKQNLAIGNEILEGKVMRLPNNLSILATMNTSDQSLFPMDSAFKRRWDWKYFAIRNEEKQYKINVDGKEYDWWKTIEALNEKILGATKSSDKQIGYWFAKLPEGETVIDAERFVSKVVFYLWNDVFKDFSFGDNNPFTKETTFEAFFDAKGNVVNDVVKAFLDRNYPTE